MRGHRYEISTSAFDPALQGVWSDPYGGTANVGLRVPQVLPTVRDPQHRLLFTLAFARFGARKRVRLVGYRQLLTIAALIPQEVSTNPPFIFEQQVTTPYWSFPDANFSWHIMRVPPGSQPRANPSNADSVAYRYATGSALLFEKGPNKQNYVPPNGGRPLGTPVSSSLGNLHDIRAPWQTENPLDIEIEGPCDIVFYASGQQTSPSTRVKTPIIEGGFTFAFGTTCLPTEASFVADFENQSPSIPVTYWRVAGSLIFEEVSTLPWPKELGEDDPMPWCGPTGQMGGLNDGTLEPPPRKGGSGNKYLGRGK